MSEMESPQSTSAVQNAPSDQMTESERKRAQIVQNRKTQNPLYYGDYLRVKDLLSLQNPASRESGEEAHDEHLFIVIHQVYELWFKQILHEIDSIKRIFSEVPVDDSKISIAVSRLQRIREIQQILVQQVSVLETMKPTDFLDFRDYLYPASGFQSVQFRLIENKLGLLKSQRLTYGQRGYCSYLHGGDAEVVQEAENEKSLFDLVEAWLERTPFLEQVGGWSWWEFFKGAVERMHAVELDQYMTNPSISDEERAIAAKDIAATREHFENILDKDKYNQSRKRGDHRLSYRALLAALLINLYSDEPIFQLPYRFLSNLLDIDELLTQWRNRHALMVHRMIGVKFGTGGSAGYHYLRATAERHKIFSDLFNLSTFLIPRSMLPPLPAAVKANFAFAFGSPPATLSSPLGGLSSPRNGGSSDEVVNNLDFSQLSVDPSSITVPVKAGKCPFGYGNDST